MSYDTSSDTKVVNLNPMGYSPEAASMPSPVASMPPPAMDGGKRALSSSSSSGSSSSGSRRRSHRKSRDSRDRDTSSSEEDYEDEEDYSDEEEDGKEKALDKVVVQKDGSVSSRSSRSSKSSKASSYTEDSEEESEEEDAISMTSTEILENDPLFFVLSRIFVTHDKKKNIADLLQEVVDLLKEQRDHRMQRMQGGHPGGHTSSISMQKY